MTIDEAERLIVHPVLVALGDPYDSVEAAVLLLTIGQTESGFRTRLQKPIPHAHGFWQFERGGGCAEFEQHRRLGRFRTVARSWHFQTNRTATWSAIGNGADHLACLMARALLWIDPTPLPAVGDVEAAYAYYIRRWRPGKPSKARFKASYALVLRTETEVA